jgi:16S rRNA (guanine966-N2)-methyltransferase
MRIIGGKLKRRQLPVNSKLPVRPTTDMAKEALFNILNNNFDFSEINVLDLFAGTGSISFEFASRGAVEVISVDNNVKCIAYIKDISAKLEVENLKTIKSDSLHFVSICRQAFNIIFADPPYDYAETKKIPELIIEKKLLKPDGWLIIEHPKEVNMNHIPGFFDKRNYGKVHFSFFKNI